MRVNENKEINKMKI